MITPLCNSGRLHLSHQSFSVVRKQSRRLFQNSTIRPNDLSISSMIMTTHSEKEHQRLKEWETKEVPPITQQPEDETLSARSKADRRETGVKKVNEVEDDKSDSSKPNRPSEEDEVPGKESDIKSRSKFVDAAALAIADAL